MLIISKDDLSKIEKSKIEKVELKIAEHKHLTLQDDKFIICPFKSFDELVEEGIAREFISKVQNIRKTKDFNIVDRINVVYSSDEEVKEAITSFKEYISNEILALSIEFKENNGEIIDINDHEVKVEVEVAK